MKSSNVPERAAGRQLAPLTSQPGEWRPEWPAKVWLLVPLLLIAAPIIAVETAELPSSTVDMISLAAWSAAAVTEVLIAVLAYAFSESLGPRRLVYGAVAGGISFAASWGIVLAALNLSHPLGG